MIRKNNIFDVMQFRDCLISVGVVDMAPQVLEKLWKRYREYLFLRDAIDISLSEKLFLSWRGNAMDESLAAKSLERLLR
ncbi:hypothetical protein [Cellvibrio sp. NN19]|uniref:hypothetical protein n=1 Tax=Cellvibrio chitinivorans TaxID=3102792 RepID=UPI002B41596B|nr:hypothetical protein [Cellvibrio sp. NN19]